MPHYEREVALVPVQSSQRHARIRCVDTAAGLAMPGVVAWIAAADVPGSNLWGGNGVADEQLFPIETVLYVSKQDNRRHLHGQPRHRSRRAKYTTPLSVNQPWRTGQRV